MDESGPQLPLLIGVEIASGLPNVVINHIVDEAFYLFGAVSSIRKELTNNESLRK